MNTATTTLPPVSERGLQSASATEPGCGVQKSEASDSRTLRRTEVRAPSQARQVFIIAAKEFSDRLRSGWVITCVLVWLGAVGFTSLFGLVQIGHIGMQGYERTVMSLLNLVQYLVPLLGLLLGHDLIVSEREERTLPLMLAAGVSRTRLLLGKFLGGAVTLALPLVLGFSIAGTAIGLATKDGQFGSFLLLAGSALALGMVFLGVGLLLSTLCRTRVRALVAALLAWGVFVFVFDLVALGMVISSRAPAAAQEIEVVCDATHLNAAVDIHAAFDAPDATRAGAPAQPRSNAFSWVLINPVNLFRAVNLAAPLNLRVPVWTPCLAVLFWLAGTLGIAAWRIRQIDL